jgi:hypothetical protein
MIETNGTLGKKWPQKRVVLLGASNLTVGIATAIDVAGHLWGRPLDIMASFGHGRSYGLRRSLLGRELPGIKDCLLWEELARRPVVPTAALITDIGNDILYGVPVSEISDWIRWTIGRLQKSDAKVVVTLLPMASIARLSTLRFTLLRRLLFPSCTLSLDAVLDAATALNASLYSICSETGCHAVEHRLEWYGFDPIHIKLSQWLTAWIEFMTPWTKTHQPSPNTASSLRRWFYLQSRAPARRRLLGFDQMRDQPSGKLQDGSPLSFF